MCYQTAGSTLSRACSAIRADDGNGGNGAGDAAGTTGPGTCLTALEQLQLGRWYYQQLGRAAVLVAAQIAAAAGRAGQGWVGGKKRGRVRRKVNPARGA